MEHEINPDIDSQYSQLSAEQMINKKKLERNMLKNRLSHRLEQRPMEHEINPNVFMEPRNKPKRRGRGYSAAFKQQAGNLEELFGHKLHHTQIPDNVFQMPSKKRRFSVEHENAARFLENNLRSRPDKEELDENLWITAKDTKSSHGTRRVSHAFAGKQEQLGGLFAHRQNHYQLPEKV